MKYLLDTNICIAYLRGSSPQVVQKMALYSTSDLALCSIVRAELRYGALGSVNKARSVLLTEQFLARFISLPLDDQSADRAAQIRYELSAQGLLISPHDMLIAAIVLANDLTLVTHNVREFSRVAGLRIEDWQETP